MLLDPFLFSSPEVSIMSFQAFPEIKWQRLALAVMITFLLADSIPHPNLGPGLTSLGLEQLHHVLNPDPEEPALSTAVQP